jgi:hypothetical protein
MQEKRPPRPRQVARQRPARSGGRRRRRRALRPTPARVERAVANRRRPPRSGRRARRAGACSLVASERSHRRSEEPIDGRDQPRIVSAENDGTAAGHTSRASRDLALDVLRNEIVREARRQRVGTSTSGITAALTSVPRVAIPSRGSARREGSIEGRARSRARASHRAAQLDS